MNVNYGPSPQTMNNIYVPAHVVVLLRSIANVVGGFSISHHYLLYRKKRAELQLQDHKDVVDQHPKDLAWDTIKAVDWPSWPSKSEWKQARRLIRDKWMSMSQDARGGMYQGLLKSDALQIPWLGHGFTWPSMLTLNLNPNPLDPQDDPPPPAPRRPSDKKRQEDPFKLLPSQQQKLAQLPPDIIHQLLTSPALYDPLRKPRFPIVLCHGLYGFDTRGPASFPSMRKQYWHHVLNILRDKVGAEVIVTSVPGTGSIASRALRLDEQLQIKARGRGINLLAHSMGGLDSRHLITHVKPREYTPLSLTTVSTPHRGSPFMDWCVDNIGIGKLRQQERELAYALKHNLLLESLSSEQIDKSTPSSSTSSLSLSLSSLPSSFTTLLLSIVDSPAYSNLTSTYLNNVFNPTTPNDPKVKYFSVASRLPSMSIWHPLWLPKMVLDESEMNERLKLKEDWEKNRNGSSADSSSSLMSASESEMNGKDKEGLGLPLWAQEREWGNDGLVTVQSAKWGEFLGILEGCDHWEIRGARGIELELPSLNLGSALPSTNSWSLLDWSRFVSAWRTEEKMERDAKEKIIKVSSTLPSSTQSQSHSSLETKRQEKERERVEDEAVIKASTDRLSMVFDWLIDQTPFHTKSSSSSSTSNSTPSTSTSWSTRTSYSDALNEPIKAPKRVVEAANEMMNEYELRRKNGNGRFEKDRVRQNGKDKEKEKEKERKVNELERKEDLERFYVALSRKMYDEGL